MLVCTLKDFYPRSLGTGILLCILYTNHKSYAHQFQNEAYYSRGRSRRNLGTFSGPFTKLSFEKTALSQNWSSHKIELCKNDFFTKKSYYKRGYYKGYYKDVIHQTTEHMLFNKT